MVEKYSVLHLPTSLVYRPANSKLKQLVSGVGDNDVEFSCQPTINGKQIKHPAYVAWVGMLSRSFSTKCKDSHITYIDVTTDSTWYKFSEFLFWFNDNYKESYSLDKDILIRGNKIYSPSTCIFVPQEVNCLLLTNTASRGELPIGVQIHRNKFRACIRKGTVSKLLGSFSDSGTAHRAWQKAKIEHAKELMEKYNISQLQLVIDRLQNDMNNNIITEVI